MVQGQFTETWYGRAWPGFAEDLLRDAGQLSSTFMYMVIIVVVAVPEGLPMSVTVSLALAMRKMTRANCLVRQAGGLRRLSARQR